jgi:hypothetical protein
MKAITTKSATSQICKPLWASLKTKTVRESQRAAPTQCDKNNY